MEHVQPMFSHPKISHVFWLVHYRDTIVVSDSLQSKDIQWLMAPNIAWTNVDIYPLRSLQDFTMTLYESQITRNTTVCWKCVQANTEVNTKAPHCSPFANKMTITYKSVARHDATKFTSAMTILEYEQRCNVVVKWYVNVFSFLTFPGCCSSRWCPSLH